MSDDTSSLTTLLPEGWKRPKGYSNGILAEGKMIFVAGQIGWNGEGEFTSSTMAGQFHQVLINTLAVLKVAHAGPEHIARMTCYITDRAAYLSSLKELGASWRELMGAHYPVMAVVIVSGLIESQAMIEIETTAVIS